MKLLDRSLLAIWQLYCFVSVCIATSPSKKVKVIEEPLETVTTGKETRTCTHASLLSACISQDNIGQEMIFIELQDLFAQNLISRHTIMQTFPLLPFRYSMFELDEYSNIYIYQFRRLSDYRICSRYIISKDFFYWNSSSREIKG